MLTTMTAAVAPVLAESTSADKGVSPWVIGAGTLLLLAAVMFALLVFGAGRDHS